MDEQERKDEIINQLVKEIESYRRPDRTVAQLFARIEGLTAETIGPTVKALLDAEARRMRSVVEAQTDKAAELETIGADLEAEKICIDR